MSLEFLAQHGLLYFYQANTQKPAYGMPGYSSVHFREQHMVC